MHGMPKLHSLLAPKLARGWLRFLAHPRLDLCIFSASSSPDESLTGSSVLCAPDVRSPFLTTCIGGAVVFDLSHILSGADVPACVVFASELFGSHWKPSLSGSNTFPDMIAMKSSQKVM